MTEKKYKKREPNGRRYEQLNWYEINARIRDYEMKKGKFVYPPVPIKKNLDKLAPHPVYFTSDVRNSHQYGAGYGDPSLHMVTLTRPPYDWRDYVVTSRRIRKSMWKRI